MRFLADENFPGDGVRALREVGQEIAWVRTDAPGSTDRNVLARAVNEHRVLLTFDKDFGELAWRAGLPVTSGVVLFRLRMPPAAQIGPLLCRLVMARQDWAGHFAVVEPGRVRMRPLEATS
jgi:predicted nuclease of predicted toxin-antitoxin system